MAASTETESREGFTNIPMTDEEHRAFIEQDKKWTGPKLIITAFITLGFAFTVLYLSSIEVIGPEFNDGRPPYAVEE
jgi:hypothetical protein